MDMLEMDLLAVLGWAAAIITIMTFYLGVALFTTQAPWISKDPWDLRTMLVLLVSSVLLAVFWFWVPIVEGRILNRVAPDFAPNEPGYLVVALLASVVAFTGLVISSALPALFGLVLVSVKTLEACNATLAEGHIRQGLAKARDLKALPATQLARGVSLSRWHEELDVIEAYYLFRPWRALAAIETFTVVLGGTLILATRSWGDPTMAHIALAIGTAAVFSVILVNEIVASTWRRARDRDLRAKADSV